MDTQSISQIIDLTVISCGRCGVSFAIPERLRSERKEDGETFYCPNGHPRVYRESDIEIARRERDEALRKLSAAKCETVGERTARLKAETELQRHKVRTKNGVCPCCHRSFQNLRRHIKTKHPNFAP